MSRSRPSWNASNLFCSSLSSFSMSAFASLALAKTFSFCSLLISSSRNDLPAAASRRQGSELKRLASTDRGDQSADDW